MVGKKNGSPLPGPKAPSSVQRSETLDMPYMPSNAIGSGDGGGAPPVGDSGHGGGEGSSYYSRDAASSIHGETVSFGFRFRLIAVPTAQRRSRSTAGRARERGKRERKEKKGERDDKFDKPRPVPLASRFACSPPFLNPTPKTLSLSLSLSLPIQAARRRAVTELMFFASVGDVKRINRIVAMWKLKVSFFLLFFLLLLLLLSLSLSLTLSLFLSLPSPLIPTKVSDPTCCDYDKRTPLHLAASEGCYKVTEWLLEQGADVNAIDRFRRTPLEEAVRGDFAEVAKLLIDKGGKIQEGGKVRERGGLNVEEAEGRERAKEREKREKKTHLSSSFF